MPNKAAYEHVPSGRAAPARRLWASSQLAGAAARRAIAGLLGACALAAGLACGGAERAGEPMATDVVRMPPSYLFRPQRIRVAAGTRVTWINEDHFTHSVRVPALGDTTIVVPPGDTARITFADAGAYAYDCSFHPQMMSGTVEVTPP